MRRLRWVGIFGIEEWDRVSKEQQSWGISALLQEYLNCAAAYFVKVGEKGLATKEVSFQLTTLCI